MPQSDGALRDLAAVGEVDGRALARQGALPAECDVVEAIAPRRGVGDVEQVGRHRVARVGLLLIPALRPVLRELLALNRQRSLQPAGLARPPSAPADERSPSASIRPAFCTTARSSSWGSLRSASAIGAHTA